MAGVCAAHVRGTAVAPVASSGRRRGGGAGGGGALPLRRAAGLAGRAARGRQTDPRVAPPPSPQWSPPPALRQQPQRHRALRAVEGGIERLSDAVPFVLADAAPHAAAAAADEATTAPSTPFVASPELLRLCEPCTEQEGGAAAALTAAAGGGGGGGNTPGSGAKLKVAVLLSGGVDSSVALTLLQAAGHDCVAFYLQIWFQAGPGRRCLPRCGAISRHAFSPYHVIIHLVDLPFLS